jgi:hypothetical protein
MSVQARDGASAEQLHRLIDLVMVLWPELNKATAAKPLAH